MGSARRGSNPLAVGFACLWVPVRPVRPTTITTWNPMRKWMHTQCVLCCTMRMSCCQNLTRATETKMEGECLSCKGVSVLRIQVYSMRIWTTIAHIGSKRIEMDTLGIEPRASRMLSGCDTTTPCARKSVKPVHGTMPTSRHRRP